MASSSRASQVKTTLMLVRLGNSDFAESEHSFSTSAKELPVASSLEQAHNYQ
jgi:hypothetical protein